ncbi:RNA pseudouridine synthase [Rubellicoccus peritrichatus]|uniref:RNA pseudouridine synthase n=1 Tax=Rubellicoccus peritrichatus TaxID=3080537 RepID=A0AAQ3LBN5_9BACT|nr:RNA pseudouridine synthase [Puniceicoccus sp. CR14]WOO42786.1 RNA pseudouridine synthase [Puniceicoccus sp. CR14]
MSEDITALERKLALGKGVRILKTDPCGLIALEKPPGIKSHPNDSKASEHCLINAEYDMNERRYYNLVGEDCFDEVFLIHRLDSATSGVILICKSLEVQDAAQESFQRKRVKKLYQAIVKGRPRISHKTWIDRIERKGEVHVRTHAGDSKTAQTDYNLLRMDDNRFDLALLLLQPVTGRTHQLRYQCKKHGHPILGDRNYGDFSFNKRFSKILEAKRLFLHASSIEIDLFKGDRRTVFSAESELPEAFNQILSFDKELQKKLNTITPSEIIRIQQQRIGRVPPPTKHRRHKK